MASYENIKAQAQKLGLKVSVSKDRRTITFLHPEDESTAAHMRRILDSHNWHGRSNYFRESQEHMDTKGPTAGWCLRAVQDAVRQLGLEYPGPKEREEPKPRETLSDPAWWGEEDTWMEGSGYCGPNGSKTRRARVRMPDGRLKVMFCGLSEHGAAPVRRSDGDGFITVEDGVLVFERRTARA